MPANHQVEAMALARNGLVLAGRAYDPKANTLTGFVWIVSAENGKKVAEQPLETVPVYDGLALGSERVYLSLQNSKLLCFGPGE